MIKLSDVLLKETYELKERRIGSGRISGLMEKLLPTLTKPQQKKITEAYAKLLEGITKVNEMQYSFANYEKFERVFREEVDNVARDLITKLNEVVKKSKNKPNAQIAEMTVVAISELCLLD